jgi:8-hydroxy-5-deazaflavin:NADPH oxidoreductase
MNERSAKMNVAIIGNGNVGRALGQALALRGHQIIFGVRSPQPGSSSEKAIAEAIHQAHVTILAVPFAAVAQVIDSAGDLAGKVLIDATNPLGVVEGGLELTMGFTTSGAEQIAAQAPGALLFKTFNQTGFENMADPRPYASRPVMFIAGDDPTGKQTVVSLVSDAGFDAVDVGGLRQARLLEPFAMLWIELARKRGPNFAFSLQQKESIQ